MWRFAYAAGAQRIALRVLGDPDPARNGLFFLVGNHLGSTSAVLDDAGQRVGERLYEAWGEVRYGYGWGTTETCCTGQREQAGIEQRVPGLVEHGKR